MLSPELNEKGQALLDAAYEYWKQAHKDGVYGAIIWLDDTDGRTVVFTRGEYRSQLLYNIDGIRQDVRFFTHNMNTGAEIDESKNLDYPSDANACNAHERVYEDGSGYVCRHCGDEDALGGSEHCLND